MRDVVPEFGPLKICRAVKYAYTRTLVRHSNLRSLQCFGTFKSPRLTTPLPHMSFPLRALRVPECSSCIGRLAIGVSENWFALPLQQQVRGKKKLAKDIDTRL